MTAVAGPRRTFVRPWVKRLLAAWRATGKSPNDPARGVAIVCYHATVTDPRHPWHIDFRGQMQLIEELGYQVVSLGDAVDLLRRRVHLTRPSLAITFDDGWADNLDVAYPELARRGWPATVFLPTSYLGRRPYLIPEEVPRLREFGVEIGNHSHSHRDLTALARHEIVDDLRECSRRLEDLCGARPRFFCYPDGRYSPGVRDAVAQTGMEAACTGRVGFNDPDQDLFRLRRLTVDPGDGPRELRLRLAGGYDFLDRRQGAMDRT